MTARRLPSGTDYDRLLDSLRTRAPWATVTGASADESVKSPRSPIQSPRSAPGDWASVTALVAGHDPDAIALESGDRLVSYGELRAWAARLAGSLREAGVARGDIVALVADRGPELVAAVLGTWLAGAAFLPLGARNPAAWRSDLARQAGAVACLVERGREAVPGLPWFDIDGAATASPHPGEPLAPGDLAYVIYTSGSTGVPKLAMAEHGGVANLVRVQRTCLAGVGPAARVLQFSDATFDGSVFDLLLALGHGARLVCPPASATAGGPLAAVLRDQRITHAALPAAVVRTLEPGRHGSLACLLSVGDVCHPGTAARWSGYCQFVNGYGPTETTVCATLHVAGPEDGDRGSVPVGVPVPGCEVSIVDGDLRAVPDGEVGEICIGGLGTGRGYLGDPVRTAERFVTDPVTGSRRYRTGDLGRVREDGEIEFVGRKDLQVKVRGYRVEPEYVEAALSALPGVRDAAVVADSRGLTGFVLPAGDPAPAAAGLLAALAARLPAHLVPDRVEVRAEWPLTPGGKVDRAALRGGGRQPAGAGDQAGSPLERALTAIVAELLGVGDVRRDDDLFALGAHSLLAAQLAARIRAELHRTVELSDLLGSLTVAGLAAIVRAAPEAAADGPEPVDGLVPVPSFAQRRALLMDELSGDSGAYRAQAVLRLAGPLRVSALAASLTDLVRRHDVLRSRFTADAEQTRVEILPPWRVELPVTDYSGIPAAEQGTAVGAAVREIVLRPLRADADRLVRWQLIRLGPEEHLLVQVEHHTVHDGWSFNVFLNDMVEGYLDYQRFGAVRRAELPLGYYDFTHWQDQWLRGEDAARQRAFWRTALAGAPAVLELPRKAPATRRRFAGSSPRLQLDRSLARDLAELSRREGTTLFVTMLAAFFALLHRFGAGDDLLVASGLANRRWRSTEDLLGMFVNTVVLRGSLAGDPPFRDLLRRTRDMALAAYDHQDLPFEHVVDEVNPVRAAGVNPLVQAAFSFHDSPLRPLRSVPWDITGVEALANGSAKFDLNLVAVPLYAEPGHSSRLPGDIVVVPRSEQPVRPSPRRSLDGITVFWEFAVDVLDEALVESMMAAYAELLRGAVRDPGLPVSRLPLLSPAREREMVDLGRGDERGAAAEASTRIEAVVAGWAVRAPDAPAVLTEAGDLTYRDLVGRARGLAATLNRAGVRAGDVVAVCLPPGADLIVSLLGVLSAGAAYLPLDPGHPEARRTLMAEDSGARAAIAEAPFGSLLTVPPRGDDSPAPALATVPAPATVPTLAGTPDDLAYLIYTSGSTGTPKAVQVPHRALLRRLLIPGFLGLGPDTVFLQAAPAIFDMSALEIWGALLHGGAVRVPPAGRDARALGRFVAGSDITHVAMVPALAESVLDEAPAAFGDVERVMVGGEVVSPGLIRRLKAGGTRSVATIYGPTEATIIASTWQADGSADTGSTVPLGRPLPGTRLVVLGPHGQVVPRGATGEICIGGPGVSDGYRGRPGLTAQRFVPDPERPGGRLYRSGDLGRWNAGGDLEFAGRIDEQVKVRGFRIEPGEVQAALTSLPEVSGALVMADAGAGGTARLIAYVTAAPGTAPRGSGLKQRLAERLPEYMVPSVITVLDEFPLADTGKIDRSRLPRPRPEAATGFVAPRNPAERAAAVIAADLLGAERVGVFDNFFELGGDSLLATRLAASLRKALRRDIGLADVLTTPTVAELAALPRQAAASPITPRPRAGRRSR